MYTTVGVPTTEQESDHSSDWEEADNTASDTADLSNSKFSRHLLVQHPV